MPSHQLGFDFGPSEPEEPIPADGLSPTDALPATPEHDRGGHVCALVNALARVSRDRPLARKVVVGRTRGEGRELLRQLALVDGSWVGFEVTTLRPLAIEIAGRELASQGLRLIDDFDQESAIDDAIDEVLLAGAESEFSELARGVGLRRAIADAIISLRLTGIGARRLQDARLADSAKGQVLTDILRAYESRLRAGRLADTAAVFRAATKAVKSGEAAELLGDRHLLLLPGIHRKGLAGRFLRALEPFGVEVLAADPVVGLEVPASLVWSAGPPTSPLSYVHDVGSVPPPTGGTLDIFSASSVTAELREVLRRAMAQGLRWDEIEIVTPDAQVYGSALHAVTERLRIPVSFSSGLPVERTRPGRVITAYFRWLEGGFGAEVVRTLLHASDLTAPRPNQRIQGATLARRLRELRIGWGRDRYLPALDAALRSLDAQDARKYETPEQLETRKGRMRGQLEALRALLQPALRTTPAVPGRLDRASTPVSPADLARGLRSFVRYASRGSAVDDTALERLLRTLDRVEATLTRTTEYRAAAAILRRHLAFRVPAPRAEGKAPWSSAGGSLYLTDLAHGGMTGRRATFVVGLDAHRFPGPGFQDPLLLDSDRLKLGGRDLQTSIHRLEEHRFEVAALLARLRGSVCLSYSAWDPSEARAVPPSAELLQAFRLMRGDATCTFEDLNHFVGAPAGVVPSRSARLDSEDVWMGALGKDGRLLDGEREVRHAFPGIGAGLASRDALHGDVVTAFHGQISPRPDLLDPRLNPERPVSASGLGDLGSCPRRFFYRYVLKVYPPDEPEFDPERWLNALQRGSVLHRVYERALREARAQGVEYRDSRFRTRALEILSEESEHSLQEIPAPSRAVRIRELRALEDDVDSFIAMIRDDQPAWIEIELAFGLGREPPVPFPTPDGTVPVRGAIDRVDELPDGLRVVDYKTGKSARFGPSRGTYDAGRRLQHVIYATVASQLLGRDVTVMEYHFPTRRGENRVIAYPTAGLLSGPELISKLLDIVAGGHFLATDKEDDCRFCDYQSVCRVREGAFWSMDSPVARWVNEHRSLDELAIFRKVRNWDLEGDGFLHALQAMKRQ